MGTRGIINLKKEDKEKAAVDMKVKFAAFINSGEVAEQLLVKAYEAANFRRTAFSIASIRRKAFGTRGQRIE